MALASVRLVINFFIFLQKNGELDELIVDVCVLCM